MASPGRQIQQYLSQLTDAAIHKLAKQMRLGCYRSRSVAQAAIENYLHDYDISFDEMLERFPPG